MSPTADSRRPTARVLQIAAVGLVLQIAALANASPTVAVMPFKDLSGGPANVGEAIRETVTSDLRDVPGLRVIERANLDRVLAEQNLQAKKTDLDPLSTVKVGKLLGATLMVAGAYQRSGPTVRLTARFVNVETGEIVGTAKVDGPEADLFTLQDRVTVELLKSAGIAPAHVQKFAKRTRPKLKSLKTVELYGDAVVEHDDEKKRELLVAALDEDPTFTYASRDLDALEKRLQSYEAQRQSAEDRKIRAAIDDTNAKLKTATDPAQIRDLDHQLFQQLGEARRWVTLYALLRKLNDHPPPPAPPMVDGRTFDEVMLFDLVMCEFNLKMRDAVLRDGETFLRKFPASSRFSNVKMMMGVEIEFKRQVEAGKPEAARRFAELDSRARWDLCRVADVYHSAHQYPEAQRLYRACLEMGTRERRYVLLPLISIDTELADWKSARKDLDLLGKEQLDNRATIMQGLSYQVPSDG